MNNAMFEPATATGIEAAVVAGKRKPNGFMKVLRNYPMIFVGGAIVVVLLLIALFAPMIAHYDPTQPFNNGISDMGMPVGPSHQFIWGTDLQGRDVFSRVVYGARVSLEVGVFASVISLFIGTFMGIVSGYFGGWIDMVIMRLTDSILAIPILLFVVALVAVLKPSATNVFIAIGVLGWAQMARIIRGQVLAVKELEYIHAAKALGASSWSIIFVEVLPNVVPPIIVVTTLAVGQNITLEAALSFLGFGVQPPWPSWGNMIEDGFTVFKIAPWLIMAPGVALLVAIIGFNLLGDGLRDWLDPRVGR
jgi:ABC-type dipeptide/oligopeptide/nickel transport system permease subunit